MNSTVFEANVRDIEGRNIIKKFYGLPEECPECHRGQNFPAPYANRKILDDSIASVFQCLFSDCRQPFFGNYLLNSINNYYIYSSNFIPRYSKPSTIIPKIIDEISPMYRKMYEQSIKAEENDLDLISGCGYRKALEFLIKDYAIKLIVGTNKDDNLTKEQTEKIKSIKNKKLSLVIKDDVNIPKVQSMASRAVWLGNDETHYERRLEAGDITVMKDLIQLTILHIETEELTKKMEIEIQPSNKQ